MRMIHVNIANVLGLTECEFKPGAGVTLIEGENGAGKSSVVKAILAVTGGAQARLLPTFLRKGADVGKCAIVLSDNSEFIRYFERDESGKVSTRLEGKYPNGRPMKEPAKAIRDLFDSLVNPLYLLRDDVSAAERVRWLLEALPLKADPEKLAELTGRQPAEFAAAADQHALVAIDRVYEQLYQERHDANVQAIAKRKSIGELNEAVPAESEGAVDWGAEVGRLNRELGALNESIQGAATKADALLRAEIERLQSGAAAAANAIRDRANAEIKRIRDQAQADMAAEDVKMNAAIAEARQMKDAAVLSATQSNAARRAEIAGELATATAAQKEESRIRSLIAMRDRTLGEAEALEAKHRELQERMDQVSAYKETLLADLPIPGLDIRGGELYLDGIDFPMLNTAKQVRLVIDIAMLRAGKCGLICVDGLNDLDERRRRELLTAITESGLQAICTDKSPAAALEVTTL